MSDCETNAITLDEGIRIKMEDDLMPTEDAPSNEYSSQSTEVTLKIEKEFIPASGDGVTNTGLKPGCSVSSQERTATVPEFHMHLDERINIKVEDCFIPTEDALNNGNSFDLTEATLSLKKEFIPTRENEINDTGEEKLWFNIIQSETGESILKEGGSTDYAESLFVENDAVVPKEEASEEVENDVVIREEEKLGGEYNVVFYEEETTEEKCEVFQMLVDRFVAVDDEQNSQHVETLPQAETKLKKSGGNHKNEFNENPTKSSLRVKNRSAVSISKEQHKANNSPFVFADCTATSKTVCGSKSKAGHYDGTKYLCEYCATTFETKQALKSHSVGCTKEQLFCCEHCTASFKSLPALRAHLSNHLNVKLYPCPYCSAELKTIDDMEKHLAVHAIRRRLLHADCDATTVFLNTASKRKSLPKQHAAHRSNEITFSCKHCSANFKSKCEMRLHLNDHSKEKLLGCLHCDAKFERKAELQLHLLRQHAAVRFKDLPFPCLYCAAQFKVKRQLDQHAVFHLKVKPLSCPYCTVKLSTVSGLGRHLAIHVKKKLHAKRIKLLGSKSSVESKDVQSRKSSFSVKDSSQSTLSNPPKENPRQHSAAKILSCPHCALKFNTIIELEQHIVVHSKQAAYLCLRCCAQFATMTELKQHSEFHLREKLVTCKYCSAKFKTSNELGQHVAFHSFEELSKKAEESELLRSRQIRESNSVQAKNMGVHNLMETVKASCTAENSSELTPSVANPHKCKLMKIDKTSQVKDLSQSSSSILNPPVRKFIQTGKSYLQPTDLSPSTPCVLNLPVRKLILTSQTSLQPTDSSLSTPSALKPTVCKFIQTGKTSLQPTELCISTPSALKPTVRKSIQIGKTSLQPTELSISTPSALKSTARKFIQIGKTSFQLADSSPPTTLSALNPPVRKFIQTGKTSLQPTGSSQSSTINPFTCNVMKTEKTFPQAEDSSPSFTNSSKASMCTVRKTHKISLQAKNLFRSTVSTINPSTHSVVKNNKTLLQAKDLSQSAHSPVSPTIRNVTVMKTDKISPHAEGSCPSTSSAMKAPLRCEVKSVKIMPGTKFSLQPKVCYVKPSKFKVKKTQFKPKCELKQNSVACFRNKSFTGAHSIANFKTINES